MSRDLTDLMERATSFAPPEPHAAADITRLAARHQHRRTASIAGGLALAVVVAGAAGYGVSRGRDTTPEPADHLKHGQSVDLSAAVPAGSLPGYRLEPWTLSSVEDLGPKYNPLATYHDLDADGRLILETVPRKNQRNPPQYHLYDGPGQSPQPLQVPPSPGKNAGQTINWVPSFLGEGRLIWVPDRVIVDSAKAGFHVTDLQGGHDVFVHTSFTVGNEGFDATPSHVPGDGVAGDRMWFLVYDHSLPHFKGDAYTLYTATFAGSLTKVAEDVAVADVNEGRVAWITTDGKVATEDATGGSPHRVDVPLDAGCQISSTQFLQSLHAFVVGPSVIALTERCGSGKDELDEPLAFDPSGHPLVHLTGLSTDAMLLGGDSLLIEGAGPSSGLETLRYDLVTGSLARLTSATPTKMGQTQQARGDYVLWYDKEGGHVARIPR
jgi:hypothetical protein